MVTLAGAIAIASCIFPVDKTRPIEFINQTGQRIVLWEQGRQYPGARYEVAAGARHRDVWLAPELDPADEKAKFRVEATNIAGVLIFCHDYTMKEFTQVKWVLVCREVLLQPPAAKVGRASPSGVKRTATDLAALALSAAWRSRVSRRESRPVRCVRGSPKRCLARGL